MKRFVLLAVAAVGLLAFGVMAETDTKLAADDSALQQCEQVSSQQTLLEGWYRVARSECISRCYREHRFCRSSCPDVDVYCPRACGFHLETCLATC